MGKIKETRIYKRLDNFWYHYKWIVLIVALFALVVGVCSFQMFTKTQYDIYVMYAGPAVVPLQNAIYIENAFEDLSDVDFNNDGKVEACLRDLTVMSPDEIKAQSAALETENVKNEGLMLNEQLVGLQMSDAVKTFNQEIFGGDSVICLLSPYMYSTLPKTDGISDAFMPLEEVLGYTPGGAYDECAVYLKSTDFGKYSAGLSALPDDTLLCVRRKSTMSFLKGERKTEKAHAYQLEKFKAVFEYVHENG